MTRVDLPTGISLVGVIWERPAPLWIEKDEWGVRHLCSLAGEVAPGAAIIVQRGAVGLSSNARTVKLWLEQMGYSRIEVHELQVVDFQI